MEQRSKILKNAWLLILESKSSEARTELRKLLKLNPGDKNALILIGNSLELQNKHKYARRYFFAALRADPKYVPAIIDIADSYSISNDYAKAMIWYNKAFAILNRNTNLRRYKLHLEETCLGKIMLLDSFGYKKKARRLALRALRELPRSSLVKYYAVEHKAASHHKGRQLTGTEFSNFVKKQMKNFAKATRALEKERKLKRG